MKEKILNPWNYDKILNHLIDECTEHKSFETKLHKLIKIHGKENIKVNLPKLEILKNPSIDDYIKYVGEEIPSMESKLQGLRSTKVFHIGPATIDSLINQEPESYEYIKEGKIPFNNIFFNLSESIDMWNSLNSSDMIGMHLFRVSQPGNFNNLALDMQNAPPFYYTLHVYYSNQKKNSSFELLINPKDPKILYGKIGVRENELYMKIDLGLGEVNYASQEELANNPNKYSRRSNLNPGLGFQQIANLCTNLINYINAHNVTFVRKNRNVDIITRNERNKKKKISRIQPYYIVEVKDGFCVEPEEPSGRTWTLNWRVYVRGHDRRFRNKQGEIYMISWIAPHIKGPVDAPWKENRYKVLAEKLLRERELMNRIN